MKFLYDNSTQTNWKHLTIVAVVGLLASGGILLLKAMQTPQDSFIDSTIPPQVGEIFAIREECEAKTGKKCSFVMCDYVLPGKTFEEVCGEDFKKGWQPTSESVEVNISTWQTYRNDEFGFEVKYPADRFAVAPIETFVPYFNAKKFHGFKLIRPGAKERLGREECRYGEADRATTCTVNSEDGIGLIVVDGDSDKTVSYIQEEKEEYAIERNIGGRRAVSYTDTAEGYHTSYYFMPLTQEFTLVIIKTWASGLSNEQGPIHDTVPEFDQILATFRFIE